MIYDMIEHTDGRFLPIYGSEIVTMRDGRYARLLSLNQPPLEEYALVYLDTGEVEFIGGLDIVSPPLENEQTEEE
tara:strand:- start:33 stop:257 length:225 start_codon:yes stop_codon:yes gene_type:complete